MFSCTCDSGYDIADIFNTTMRTARKEHWCCECGCTIERGQQYEYITALSVGHWSSHKTCLVCAKIASVMQLCGRVPGVLWDHVHEANCSGDALDGSDDFCICPTRRAR